VTPDVSVLLPYRDAAATLPRALASVLAQADVAFELLAVDDGSTDGGPAVIAEAARRDARVRPLAARGAGIARALEVGRAAARAPFLARMDADDVAAPERLARQLAALRADPHLAVLGTRVVAEPKDGVGQGLGRYVAWQNSLLTPADHARQMFVEAPLCHPSVMARAEAVAAVGGWRQGPFPEDYDLWLRLDAAGARIAKLPDVLLSWWHRPGRATFSDARYSPEALLAVKAPHLARRVRAHGRPVAVWGAGPTGKRLARALEPHEIRAAAFIDIDPRKIGRHARGVEVLAPEALDRGAFTVLASVGAEGARDQIRAFLDARGFVEGDDYLCAA